MKDGRFSFSFSIGVDLIEYSRARALLRSGGPRLRRILSEGEWRRVRRSRRPERVLAAILASREAVFKSSAKNWMGPDGFKAVRSHRVSLRHAGHYVVATAVRRIPCAGT